MSDRIAIEKRFRAMARNLGFTVVETNKVRSTAQALAINAEHLATLADQGQMLRPQAMRGLIVDMRMAARSFDQINEQER